MLTTSEGFSGMSVKDVPEAVAFWRALGLTVDDGPIATVHLPGGGKAILYPKDDHEPATFTVLNFRVDDVAVAIRELAEAGVEPLRYPGTPQDEDGAMRGRGPDIAWFADPSGNVFSVLKP